MPIEEKKKIRNNFFSRLLIVLFFMISFLFLITTVAILPAFFISYQNKQMISKNLEIQKNQQMPKVDEEAKIAVDSLNTKLNLVEKAINNKYIFSQKIIDELFLRKTIGIKITKIFYENDEFKGRKVVISGIAQNREQLLQFRKTLENSDVFKDINLPISNFVKGQNIQFNLELSAL